MFVAQKSFRSKKRIALGVLAVWTAFFCLSFCDELGFWVNAGKVADQAVEQILASPSVKLSSDIGQKDEVQQGLGCDIMVRVYAVLDTNPNDPRIDSQPIPTHYRPPLFQVLSRLLI